ncbi:hypothetical protein A2U01_0079161, partial [Trifolium medium]|nr:hypothetical protein [Trifolium medium]
MDFVLDVSVKVSCWLLDLLPCWRLDSRPFFILVYDLDCWCESASILAVWFCRESL